MFVDSHEIAFYEVPSFTLRNLIKLISLEAFQLNRNGITDLEFVKHEVSKVCYLCFEVSGVARLSFSI